MYSEEYIGGAIVPKSNASLTAASLVSAAVYASWAVMEQIQLTRIMLVVSTQTLTGLVAPVVTFWARPTPASSSGEVSLGTLTIPSGSTVGQVIYKDIESIKIPPGYDLCVEVTTAGTDGGSAAGAGFVGFKGFSNPEDPRNVAKMVKSA